MTLATALALTALLAAAWLFLQEESRWLAAVAGLAAGVEVAMAMGWLRLAAPGGRTSLVLAAALALPGLVAWWRAGGKGPVTAAAVVAFTGLVQLALALWLRL